MADHFVLFCVLGFLVQLGFCILLRNPWLRMIPLFAILGCMIYHVLAYMQSGELFSLAYLVAWGCVLLAAEAAWISYAVVKLFKNAKKSLSVQRKNT